MWYSKRKSPAPTHHQVHVALDVCRLVLAVPQVDVGHSHACLGVVRAIAGDLAQLQRGGAIERISYTDTTL